MARGKMKTRVGVVTSDKMDKTVVVEIEQIISHSTYQKPMKRTSRFKAHDEKNECKTGDRVLIIESRPLSHTKRWRVSKVLSRRIALPDEIPGDVFQNESRVPSGEGEKLQ